MEKKENILSFYLTVGNFEILAFLENNSPVRFKEIRDLTNPNTSKKFSSKTVSQRLKELEANGDIQNEIVTYSSRRSIGYAITEKGKKTLKILKETQEKFERLNE